MVSIRPTLTVETSGDFEKAIGDSLSEGALVTKQEWQDLLHSSASNVVFMTWQWQSLWWRHFGAPDGCQLHLLVIRDTGGALVGIAPLFVALEPLPPARPYTPRVPRPTGEGPPLRIVRMVGNIEVADYLDVICPPHRLAEVWGVVLDYLLAHRDQWDVIDLHSLPGFSPSWQVLPDVVGRRGLQAQVFPEDVCPVLPLPDSWDSYLMSLKKKDRHELRRKVRKLEGRDDVRWYLVPRRNHDAMTAKMRTFLDLHRKSGAEKARFMDPRMQGFFLDMADSLIDTDWLDLAILEIGGEPASAYLSYHYGDRLYLYNSGYDPKFAAYSAGVALLAYRIHKAILQGIKYFDFLRGDEPYKYDFGARTTYVYRGLIAAGDAMLA
jgi:hypothetical protein